MKLLDTLGELAVHRYQQASRAARRFSIGGDEIVDGLEQRLGDLSEALAHRTAFRTSHAGRNPSAITVVAPKEIGTTGQGAVAAHLK